MWDDFLSSHKFYEGRKMKSLRIILLLLVTAFFISCTVKYLPVKEKGIIISEGYGIMKNDDFVFAAANEYWVKEPQNLTDYFTTFHISIRNKSEEKMKITPMDISLLDEDENQFDTVDLEFIEKMLLPKQLEYLVIQNIEDDSDAFRTLLEDQKNILEEWREAQRNLITYSFRFGEILPGAKKSGFIFFPKIFSSNNSCRIIFRDIGIQFTRGDKKEKQTE